MLNEWEEADEINNPSKDSRFRVCITVYRHKANGNYSFGAGCSMPDCGFGIPCMEEPYVYRTPKEAVTGGVKYIRERITRNYEKYTGTISGLLPDITPELFYSVIEEEKQ